MKYIRIFVVDAKESFGGYNAIYPSGDKIFFTKSEFEKAFVPVFEGKSARKTIVVNLETGNWSDPEMLEMPKLEEQEDVASILNRIAVLNETFKAFSQVIPETECKQISDKIIELTKRL